MPQIYGAIIAMLLVLLLNRIDPRDFGITWSTFLGFIGLNAVFAIANVFYQRSRS